MRLTTLRLAALAAALGVLPLHAQDVHVTFPEVNGLVEFMLPSNNIECTFIARATPVYVPKGGGPELSCDRRDPTYVNVDLGPSGPAARTDNPGEQPCCGGPNILQYGQVWNGGPFVCRSKRTGLECSHNDGHGFLMSHEKIETR